MNPLPNDLIEKAEKAIDKEEDLEHPWANTGVRLAPRTSWVAKYHTFDAEEFMFTMDFEYKGIKYTIYHAPRTGKYSKL